MNYASNAEAIIDLHERGFTEDFQICGNKIVWIQEDIPVNLEDCLTLEYHCFEHPHRRNARIIILGILAISYNAMGLLVYKNPDIHNDHPLLSEKKSSSWAKVFTNFNLLFKPSCLCIWWMGFISF